MKQKIILASSSPRRKELLTQLIGNNFDIMPSDYVEDNTEKIKPIELILKQATGKAKSVAKNLKNGIVIGADTLVLLNGVVLGKPQKAPQAKGMLKMLSGKTVDVVTGVTVIDIENKKEVSDCEITKVYIKNLSTIEINDYVKTKEPLDKAGAFAIQGIGASIVERIEGDFSNVVGLPLFLLTQLFSRLGISIYDL